MGKDEKENIGKMVAGDYDGLSVDRLRNHNRRGR